MSHGDAGETGYDDRNRAFLQAFIARSTLTVAEAKPLIAAIESAHEGREVLAEDVTEQDFRRYVHQANDAISSLDLEIRSTRHQETQSHVWAFINSASDPLAQLATAYTADEISFLKRLLDAMFETNNTVRHELLAVTSTEAIHLSKPSHRATQRRQRDAQLQGADPQVTQPTSVASDQGISGAQAQRMLEALVAQGWFERSRRGYYTLSPRALMELRGWLLDTYNEPPDEDGGEGVLRIKTCFACKEIVTMGQRCPTVTCPCRIHDICTQNFFTIQRNRDCPMCGTEWTGTNFVGERAASSRTNAGRGSAAHGRPSASRLDSDGPDAASEGSADE